MTKKQKTSKTDIHVAGMLSDSLDVIADYFEHKVAVRYDAALQRDRAAGIDAESVEFQAGAAAA